MQRIQQGHSAILTTTFYVDGVATDPSPDTATVGITRDDGTVLVAPGTATTNAGTGVVTYTLTPTDTALLDTLAVTWTATFGGQAQVSTDIVEVAGGFLFTIAQARAQPGLSAKTVAEITDARTYVESELEHACGFAFVPRYRRELVSGANSTAALLQRPKVRAIRAVALDGTTIGVSALATVTPDDNGVAYYPAGWDRGFRNYEVAYEHGLDYPPPGATIAALTWARDYLIKGPISDRATSFVTEDGTFAMATPGVRGSYSGLPVVDAFIQQYNLIAGIA